MLYIDPSGHLVCSDKHVADGDCSDEGAGLWRYGITLSGNWSKSDKSAAREAAYKVGKKISVTPGDEPWTAFHKKHGDVEISISASTEEGWGCERAGYGVACYNATGKLNPRVLAHEFGHVFNAEMVNNGQGDPYHDLKTSTIEGVYEQDAAWHRNFNGYRSAFQPDVYHGMEFDDWDSNGEDLADMYMNWVFNTFSTDSAGIARYNWMDDHMKVWLK